MNRYILQVYDLDNNKVTGLLNYNNIVRERDLKTGGDTLSFSYPKRSEKTKYIKEEHYIETKYNRYVIKEVDRSAKNWVRVTCKVEKDGLQQRVFPHFEMVNSRLEDTLNLALAGTGWTIGHNDITKRRTVRLAWCTPLEIIEEIRKVYRAEIFYDSRNKEINVYKQYGEDKGQFFMENVNLRELNIASDTHDYITRLIPLGKDGLTIEEINNGKNYLENYQYSNKIIYGVWEDNRYSVVENLKEDGEAKLDELSKPLISYEGNSIDLRGADLGDTIELVSKSNNVKTKQRVIKIVEHPLEPHENKVEIANKVMSFDEQFRETEEVVDKADTVMTSDGMIDDSKVNFNPIRQEFEHIIAEKADIVDFNAAVGRIGELEVTKANLTDVEAINAKIKTIETEDLTAINAEITAIKGNVAEIDTILSKEVFVELASVGQIVAGSGIIADGAIGDAQISSLSAGKIRSGTLDTSLVTVAGADGKLNITGNRLQVIHEGLERVALGDVNRDGTIYGLRVRGEDGETVLFDERGLTREGLTDGAIDDSKVDDSANIQGHKLDINSVIREVNNADETIKGTKIQVGDRTLDVELSTQKIAIDENSQEISNQRSEIKALDDAIKLKVDNQEFNQYKSITDNNITTINTLLSKNTASIDILREEINLKVSQTDVEKLINDIEIGGRNYILNSSFDNGLENWDNWGTANKEIITDEQGKNWIHIWQDDEESFRGIRQRVDAFEKSTDYTISFTAYKIKGNVRILLHQYGEDGNNPQPQASFEITEAPERYIFTFRSTDTDKVDFNFMIGGTAKQPFDIYITDIKFEKGNKATDWTPAPEDIESEITAINTKVADININLDSITSRVSSTESKIIKVNDEVSAIESRVSIAEQKITDDSIINTVRSSAAYKGDLNTITNQVTTVEQLANQLEINVKDYTDGILSGATYTFDGNYATFKGAGLKIQNNLGQNVLQGDINGNLQIVGNFTTYSKGNKALEMEKQVLNFYDWEGTNRKEPVGQIYSARKDGNVNEPGIALGHNKKGYLALVYQGDDTYYSYIDFDKDNILGYSKDYPITFWQDSLFKTSAMFEYMIYLGKRNKIFQSTNNALVLEVNDGSVERGFTLQGDTSGKVLDFRPWHKEEIMLWRTTKVNKNFLVAGSKNAVVNTENHGERLINAYETTEYFFGDIGSGKIDEGGLCYIYIDDIFRECVNTEIEYHVFLQKCGQGDVWIKEKHETYFIVEGTPGLNFSWELKAKRKGYEQHRLEQPDNLDFERDDSVSFNGDFEQEDKKDKELEKIYDDKLNFDLVNLLLKEVA